MKVQLYRISRTQNADRTPMRPLCMSKSENCVLGCFMDKDLHWQRVLQSRRICQNSKVRVFFRKIGVDGRGYMEVWGDDSE